MKPPLHSGKICIVKKWIKFQSVFGYKAGNQKVKEETINAKYKRAVRSRPLKAREFP
jgi:hypothetical protein